MNVTLKNVCRTTTGKKIHLTADKNKSLCGSGIHIITDVLFEEFRDRFLCKKCAKASNKGGK